MAAHDVPNPTDVSYQRTANNKLLFGITYFYTRLQRVIDFESFRSVFNPAGDPDPLGQEGLQLPRSTQAGLCSAAAPALCVTLDSPPSSGAIPGVIPLSIP